ncbi:syntaxin-11-like [Scleropages formosus]|uniref:Syntaxin 11a n=1 Tax=Scleropages formosus TaxID=113540 RepID=A0A0N8K3B3_SCLFO|nr:syntaxin-11-like [Scleropages formosus]XP_018585780.1 syntaxin-11-like [Scleropages formosus]KPP80057.1 syntaxin-11-like [Scleropages formosus]
MKDRLRELHTVIQHSADVSEVNGGEDGAEQDQEAVVFQAEGTMEDIFTEAQSMRKEIAALKMDVKRLGKQNTRFLTSVRRISSIKRDSNAIARDIKTRGEALYKRLQKLGALSKDLEDQYGINAAVVRMVRSQYTSLTKSFHAAMTEYNEAEMTQKENCKARIQRQVEIMGQEVTGDQIEEMIETGKWNVFSENLLTDGKTARSALNEIENRHKELLDLESRIRDIHDLFFQMALLVEEQGCMLENIETNVLSTQNYVRTANSQIKKAAKYKKKNPCKQLFCCCFPCCK